MTFNELQKNILDVSNKVRHIRTLSKLMELAVLECPSFEARNEKLPDFLDIAELAFMLADQANAAADVLVMELPGTLKGIKP